MPRYKQKNINENWPTKKQDIEDTLTLMELYRIHDEDKMVIYYPECYVAIADYFSDKYPGEDDYAKDVIAQVTRPFSHRDMPHYLGNITGKQA
jgi:hypothetical protein